MHAVCPVENSTCFTAHSEYGKSGRSIHEDSAPSTRFASLHFVLGFRCLLFVTSIEKEVVGSMCSVRK